MVIRAMKWLLPLLLFVVSTGCAPKAVVNVAPNFKPAPEQDLVYIVPFESILVPDRFATKVFDDFVDNLNAARKSAGLNAFFILKDGLKEVDPSWLTRQVYIKGELWGYVENSGCCQTELKAKSRIHVFEPGKKDATLDILVPAETFFDHDQSTLAKEQDKLAAKLASQLSDHVISQLSRRK